MLRHSCFCAFRLVLAGKMGCCILAFNHKTSGLSLAHFSSQKLTFYLCSTWLMEHEPQTLTVHFQHIICHCHHYSHSNPCPFSRAELSPHLHMLEIPQ